ncbi:MAG TPA: hypothetical protein VGD22_03790 [Sphingobacteriaceae bacterium]
MSKQSKKSEDLLPKDSKRKKIKHPEDDSEAVLHKKDTVYLKKDADFKNIAKKKENQEQPVYPIKTPPKDV